MPRWVGVTLGATAVLITSMPLAMMMLGLAMVVVTVVLFYLIVQGVVTLLVYAKRHLGFPVAGALAGLVVSAQSPACVFVVGFGFMLGLTLEIVRYSDGCHSNWSSPAAWESMRAPEPAKRPEKPWAWRGFQAASGPPEDDLLIHKEP